MSNRVVGVLSTIVTAAIMAGLAYLFIQVFPPIPHLSLLNIAGVGVLVLAFASLVWVAVYAVLSGYRVDFP